MCVCVYIHIRIYMLYTAILYTTVYTTRYISHILVCMILYYTYGHLSACIYKHVEFTTNILLRYDTIYIYIYILYRPIYISVKQLSLRSKVDMVRQRGNDGDGARGRTVTQQRS